MRIIFKYFQQKLQLLLLIFFRLKNKISLKLSQKGIKTVELKQLKSKIF